MIDKISAFEQEHYLNFYNEKNLNPRMIENYTMRIDVKKLQRIKSASSSDGNQLKWNSGSLFVKADCLGYESLAEIMTCWLLKFINNFSFDYVRYYPCRIYEEGIFLKNGCFSLNYLDGAEEITFGDLLQANFKPFSITYDDLRDFLLDETGIDVKKYLDSVLCLDSITRNEDRHFHNLAFLYSGSYRLAPVFDNGAACMSDRLSYPMDEDFDIMIQNIYAKPFSVRFENQIYTEDKLHIDVEGFLHSVQCAESAVLQRAFHTVQYGLKRMQHISWEPMR